MGGAIFTRLLTSNFEFQGSEQDEMSARVQLDAGCRYSWRGFLTYLTGETKRQFRLFRQSVLAEISRGELAQPEGGALATQQDRFPQAYVLSE